MQKFRLFLSFSVAVLTLLFRIHSSSVYCLLPYGGYNSAEHRFAKLIVINRRIAAASNYFDADRKSAAENAQNSKKRKSVTHTDELDDGRLCDVRRVFESRISGSRGSLVVCPSCRRTTLVDNMQMSPPPPPLDACINELHYARTADARDHDHDRRHLSNETATDRSRIG